ncbi:hypothetical protein [Bdellovibrio svalbardensis]|uniref:Uncharacterized protein n=1 Tax=Bdellovibrio svalbardensis TaxID=2972972 RepID=A0ABT6DDD0_9BACT|nr:hypothetical protein [Bdellovibrio svalbardensis]MDG0814844.1 hypothetical protein [Bdellovibrio svalbardensis]
MNTKLLLKVVMLVVALGAVIYGIKTLKSPEFSQKSNDPDNAISLLLGSDLRPLNWCFEKTTQMEILKDDGSILKTIQDPAEISSLCETMIGGVTADKLSQAVFIRRLVVRKGEKDERVLEQAKEGGLFRVQEMPFTSPMLEKSLQRLNSSTAP